MPRRSIRIFCAHIVRHTYGDGTPPECSLCGTHDPVVFVDPELLWTPCDGYENCFACWNCFAKDERLVALPMDAAMWDEWICNRF